MSTLVIDFKDVEIVHSGVPVLRNLNFQLDKAESCYIVGKSGSGKSSLLKAIFRSIPVTGSVARVLDYDLLNMKRSKVPDLKPLLSASRIVGQNLSKNSIVVFESTVYPGVIHNTSTVLLIYIQQSTSNAHVGEHRHHCTLGQTQSICYEHIY